MNRNINATVLVRNGTGVAKYAVQSAREARRFFLKMLSRGAGVGSNLILHPPAAGRACRRRRIEFDLPPACCEASDVSDVFVESHFRRILERCWVCVR